MHDVKQTVDNLCDDTGQQLDLTTTRCSPRWIVYTNQRALGAVKNNGSTLQRCLEACANETRLPCVGADWSVECWLHYQTTKLRNREARPGATQCEITRECQQSGLYCILMSESRAKGQ